MKILFIIATFLMIPLSINAESLKGEHGCCTSEEELLRLVDFCSQSEYMCDELLESRFCMVPQSGLRIKIKYKHPTGAYYQVWASGMNGTLWVLKEDINFN